MAIIDRVKYDGRPNGLPWLVYKYPSDELTLGTQLIVTKGQEALFFKGGEALDLFGEGTHTLQTGNLPVLKKFVNLPFGSKTPFSAEVYFVNMTSRLGLGWGTKTSFETEDPLYNIIVSVCSYGSYGVRIADPRMFVSELVGAIPNGTRLTHEFVDDYFNSLIINVVKTIVSKFMILKKVSFLQVTPYLMDLSAECEATLRKEFDRYGIELISFLLESISSPEEDYAILRRDKQELALGERFYDKKRSYDVMNQAARGSMGGMALMGAGFGAIPSAQSYFGGHFNSVIGNLSTPTVPSSPAMHTPQSSGAVPCPGCGAQNPDGQKFCGNCGMPLVVEVTCPACGQKNPDGQKFCGNCGQSLIAKCPVCGTDRNGNQKFCGNCGNKW